MTLAFIKMEDDHKSEKMEGYPKFTKKYQFGLEMEDPPSLEPWQGVQAPSASLAETLTRILQAPWLLDTPYSGVWDMSANR